MIKIIKYQLKSHLPSRWLLLYFLFFLFVSEGLFRFSGDGSKAVVSLLNFTLLMIPVVCITFGCTYYYTSREYIELMLAQPLKRSVIFSGIHIGLSLPLSVCFLAGVGIPLMLHGGFDVSIFGTLLATGIMISLFSRDWRS